MRRMGYRMDMDRDEEYLIAGVDNIDHFDDLLVCDNVQPTIRIKNIPYYVDDSRELMGCLEHFVQLSPPGYQVPDPESSYEDREKYLLEAVYGQSEDWKPVGITIDDAGASIAFIYKNGLGSDVMEIFPSCDECIKLLIEVERPNGDIEKYHLYMEADAKRGDLIQLIEYWPWGYREIYFKERGMPEHPDEGYFYATVIERRK